MDNQQGRLDNLLLDGVDLGRVYHKKIKDNVAFIKDIHITKDEAYTKYGLTKDEYKRVKRKVYAQYKKSIPNGFKRYNTTRYAVNRYGDIINLETRLILKQSLNRKGYPQVDLNPTITVHKVVATTFIDKSDENLQVNHKDGNKLNNNVENLEFVTPKENMEHASRNRLINVAKHKLNAKGENNNSAKLKEIDIVDIRNLIKDGLTDKYIAELYNVSRSNITMIRLRRSWKHII